MTQPQEGRADLHLHTRFSDGTDTPEQVVAHARKAGLVAMSITDHDNTQAIAIAQPFADQQGIELIPGIEMSASIENREVHVLGFYIDPENPELKEHLRVQQERRVGRVRQMVEQLKKVDIHISADDVFAIAGEGTVGRPHVAQVLQEKGYIETQREAFEHLIGNGHPGYVAGSVIEPSRVIQLILGAGGIPVLAHAVFMEKDSLIDQFVQEGLKGLEVYHSSHNTPDLIGRYHAIAERLNLLETGGSDYHGHSKEGMPVGATSVPYRCVQALKDYKANA